jgi:hypothetical protein
VSSRRESGCRLSAVDGVAVGARPVDKSGSSSPRTWALLLVSILVSYAADPATHTQTMNA